ncbi:GEVED domain-containing protein [Flavobacterium sp.]|uniref:GEVED domain-containing protein n=1 Tax=Flavobacterium sp. TaxID=239 RepID=UPI00375347C7
MKKTLFIIFVILASFKLLAQDKKTGVVAASDYAVTRPIREIFAENPVDESKLYGEKESEDRKNRKAQKFPFTVTNKGIAYGNDNESIQSKMGTVVALPIKLNIAGQTASGFRPYDPSGAVGPNHYVQMINSTTFKIYNKSTGAVMLTGALGSLWTPATANAGDPVVMYDKAADRWFLAQFGSSTDKKIYIAVSTTNDPTGSYYTYTYVSPQFPDYLKFSVWQDGYYMTSNQTTQKVFCFDRTALLAGTPGARSIYVNFSPPKPTGFFSPLPGDTADSNLMPAGTPCPIFSYSDNGWGTGFSDAVNIYNMSVNWIPATPTATVTLAANVPTAAFDASYDPSWNDVSQPGTTQKLDGIGGALMYRAQIRKWSGYNSLLLNWSVKASSTQRSIKWCELRQDQTTGVWTMYQEGIYSPDADSRWMGSMAMDNNGSIGINYLKSNATSIFPGLYYTGRRSCDPLGTLPVTETLIVAGTGFQSGGNRVGDYAHTSLDPDGVTFWGTSEYMGGTSGSSAARTRIFSYQIQPCVNNNVGVNIIISNGTNPSCYGQPITFTATPTNGGSTPIYEWFVDGISVGNNSTTYTTSTLTNNQTVSCVLTSDLVGGIGSPATSNAIVVAVSTQIVPTVVIALTSGTNPSCTGASKTFTATATNGGATPIYEWKVDGIIAGTNSPTFTTASLLAGQIVSCDFTSSLICALPSMVSSNGIIISYNPTLIPSVSIAITTGTNPSASGSSVTFTATSTNGGTPTYQWKVGTTNVGTNSASYSTTTLTNGQVVSCVMTSNATCVSPTIASSNSITMSINSYCAASTTTIKNERITKVVMGTINNTTTNSSYSNYTALSTNVVVGSSNAITVTLGTANTGDRVLIWCDWNNNGVLTDAGEAVYASATGVGPFTTSIVAPVGTPLGSKRMRIRLTRSSSGPNLTPCGVSSFGEVEDYTLNVLATVAKGTYEGENLINNNDSLLNVQVLMVAPNPSNGTFTIKSENEGNYYLIDESGRLIQSLQLNKENNFQVEVTNIADGFYILAGQNKYGITKQKIIIKN